MGKIAEAIRRGGVPEKTHQQLLALDREFVEMEAEVQRLKTQVLHLEAKVNPLEREVQRLKDQVKQHRAHQETPSYKMVYGCMRFEGDENLYCPGCYHNNDKKVATSRKTASYRYCVACKTDIPAG